MALGRYKKSFKIRSYFGVLARQEGRSGKGRSHSRGRALPKWSPEQRLQLSAEAMQANGVRRLQELLFQKRWWGLLHIIFHTWHYLPLRLRLQSIWAI